MPRLDTCAICKQTISNFDQFIVLGYGFPDVTYAFCQDCAAPIIAFLESHQIHRFNQAGATS